MNALGTGAFAQQRCRGVPRIRGSNSLLDKGIFAVRGIITRDSEGPPGRLYGENRGRYSLSAAIPVPVFHRFFRKRETARAIKFRAPGMDEMMRLN